MKLLAAAALLAAAPVHAADDAQLWSALLVQGPVQGDLAIWFDGNFRFTDDATRLGQTLMRGALGWRVDRNLTLWGGYAHIATRPDGAASIVEHRAWQQATYPILRADRFTIVGRTRLEQRWVEGQGGTGVRARQLVRVQVPLGGPRAPTALVWHEAFLTLARADWGPDTGFDQHRTLIGLALPLARGRALEVGYFEQRLPQQQPDRVNAALNLTLVIAL